MARSLTRTARGAVLPPWPLSRQTRRVLWRAQRADHAAEYRPKGRIIEADRAAERHMMLGDAGPDGRGDECGLTPLTELARRLHCHRRHQAAINHDWQVRAMLFDRSDRHDNHDVACGQALQCGSRQVGELEAGHEQGPSPCLSYRGPMSCAQVLGASLTPATDGYDTRDVPFRGQRLARVFAARAAQMHYSFDFAPVFSRVGELLRGMVYTLWRAWPWGSSASCWASSEPGSTLGWKYTAGCRPWLCRGDPEHTAAGPALLLLFRLGRSWPQA